MTVRVHSPFGATDYQLTTASVEVPDLLRMLAPEGFLGRGIIEQTQYWLRNLEPVDQYGYPMLFDDKTKTSWRDYELHRVVKSLETLSKTRERMGR